MSTDDSNTIDPNAKERLLEAAIPLFAQKGLEGTTTRDIASAAGLNVSLISYYFGGKEGLYRGVLESHAKNVRAMAEEFVGRYQKQEMTRKSFEEFIHGLVDRMVMQKLKYKDISLIMQREISAGLPYAREVYENGFSKIGEIPVNFIAEAQKKKIVRADVNPHFVIMTLVNAVDGYIANHQAKSKWVKLFCFSFPSDQDEFVKELADLFLRGTIA